MTEATEITIHDEDFTASLLALAIMCENEGTNSCDITVTANEIGIKCHIDFSAIENEDIEDEDYNDNVISLF